MPSFDIVSEIDNDEVHNAVSNASRELETRYDFRGVDAKFEWRREETALSAEADFQLRQMLDILRSNLAKRGVDVSAMEISDPIHSGKTFTQSVTFLQGIDQPLAKKIVKLIKDSKIKVQTAIQGDKIRVSGKKRDDLQAIITQIRDAGLGQPLQFNNFRD